MAKQTINLGTGELTGDGESIRSAFDKINSNFDELYTKDSNDVVLSAINGHIIPDTDVAYDLGSASNRFRDLYLSGSTIDLGGTTLSVVGGELQLGGVKIPTQAEVTASIAGAVATPTGDLTGSVFADDSTLLVDGVNGKLIGPLLTENIAHPSNDGLGIRLNSTDQSTLMVAKQSFDRTFDETFDAGYTLSILNTPNRVRVTFDVNNGLYFRGLLNRWEILFDNIRFGDPIDFEYDYSNIRLSLEPDAHDIVTNVVDVIFVSDDVYDIEIDQDPITALVNAGMEPGEISQIALRYDYNNTMGFDVERNRYGIAVDHEDIDLRAGRDIDLFAVDDFRARAGSSFNLTLESKDGRDPGAGININLESYDDEGNFIDKIWAFQFDGNLRLPIGGDIVDDNGNSVLKNLDGDLTGSVFADDSTLMVDAVNNTISATTLTTLAVFGNPTLALNADVIALDAQSGNLTLQTTNRIINNFGSAWEVQGTAASMVLNDDGVLPSELSVNIDVVDFGTGNTVDLQGNSVLFDGASIQNFAPGNIYANSGQFLYVTSKHSGGTATNVVFTYDTNINNPRQTFYGKTQFGFNGQTPVVDFDGTTIQNWTDPNVVNTHGGGAIIVVGGQTATMDNLTVRITENTPGELDVEFNYDPSSGTVAVSANGDVANRFNGTTNFTAGNTTWTTMNILTIVGDKGEFTIADHSFHKIYRVTTFARALPGGVDAGDAYCIIERLK